MAGRFIANRQISAQWVLTKAPMRQITFKVELGTSIIFHYTSNRSIVEYETNKNGLWWKTERLRKPRAKISRDISPGPLLLTCFNINHSKDKFKNKSLIHSPTSNVQLFKFGNV